MLAGVILKIYGYICTMFCTVTKTMFHKQFCRQNSLLTNPTWRRPPFWNWLISTTIFRMLLRIIICTKFGTETKTTSKKWIHLQTSLLKEFKIAASAILEFGLIDISRFRPIFARDFSQGHKLMLLAVKMYFPENLGWRRSPFWYSV